VEPSLVPPFMSDLLFFPAFRIFVFEGSIPSELPDLQRMQTYLSPKYSHWKKLPCRYFLHLNRVHSFPSPTGSFRKETGLSLSHRIRSRSLTHPPQYRDSRWSPFLPSQILPLFPSARRSSPFPDFGTPKILPFFNFCGRPRRREFFTTYLSGERSLDLPLVLLRGDFARSLFKMVGIALSCPIPPKRDPTERLSGVLSRCSPY